MRSNPFATKGGTKAKWLKDQSGQTLVVIAVFMALVALGFIAFAVDVGMLFREKRMAQAAADAVAVAAAEELAADPSNEQTVANKIAKLNGFDTTLASNPATVALATPSSGNFVGSQYVQATVSMPIHTIFLGAFSFGLASVPVSATAVGGGGQVSQTCVCLEGTTGEVLNLSNGSRLTASGCGIVDNSSSSNALGIVGGSTLSGQSLGTVSSDWDNSSNVNNGGSISSGTLIVQGVTSTCAPSMPAAPAYSSCSSDPGGSSSSFTAGPANPSGTVCYTSLTVGANGSLDTLNPGTYVITTGSLHFESGSGGRSNLGGNGVFFYLTGTASLQIDNGAIINLVAGGTAESGGTSAPSLGAYNGILIYQASSDTAGLSIQGGTSAFLNGAIYAPSAAITLGNGSSATIDGGIVANSLTMNGGGVLNANAATNEGSLTISSTSKLVQ